MSETAIAEEEEALRREIAALRARRAELEAARARAAQRIRRLELLVATMPGVVWEMEGAAGQPEHRVTHAGGQIAAILGYTPEEWTRTPDLWIASLHPEDRERVVRDLASDVERSGPLQEHRFVAKDGREVWVQPYVRVFHDAAGGRSGRSVFALDVTERVQAERARARLLDETQALVRRLDTLIASVPGVVWEIPQRDGGAADRPVVVSDHLTALTGYLPQEAVESATLWSELIHRDDRGRVARELDRILAEGEGLVEHRWVTKGGDTLWVESHVRAVKDERGAPVGLYGVTMDVTERKLGAEERQRLKDELIQAREATLIALSSPVLPIASDILVMPILGTFDAQRASQMIEALLRGIWEARARVAILDVTGVPGVDESTADALLRAVQSVRLLGMEVVLTGLRPEVTRALVGLDVRGLLGVATFGTLEGAIGYATARRRARRVTSRSARGGEAWTTRDRSKP